MAEGVILADGSDLLVALLQRPVSERMGKGAGGVAGDADHVFDARALGEIVGGNDRDEVGRPGALDVVGDCEARIGKQIADQHVAVALLDQAAGLLQGGVGVRSVVLDDEFDLAAAHLVLDLVEIELNALDHFLAAGGDDAGQRRQQADLDRTGLGLDRAPGCCADAGGSNSSGSGLQKLPAIHIDVLS